MEKKALVAIAFIIIVAFLINNAPQQTTQQRKLRAQTTETLSDNFSDRDAISDSAGYDNTVTIPQVTSRGFIQQLKRLQRAIADLPVPRFVGPSIPKEIKFDPCATNKKSPMNQIKPRLPSLPSAWNR